MTIESIKKQDTMSYENHLIYRSYFTTNPTIREISIAQKMLEFTDIETLKNYSSSDIMDSLMDNRLIEVKYAEDIAEYINAIDRLKKYLRNNNISKIKDICSIWGWSV